VEVLVYLSGNKEVEGHGEERHWGFFGKVKGIEKMPRFDLARF
jgi:hypothetical protein